MMVSPFLSPFVPPTTPLNSAPIGTSQNMVTINGYSLFWVLCKLLILWSHPPGSNRRPADYESLLNRLYPPQTHANWHLPVLVFPVFWNRWLHDGYIGAKC